MECKSPAMNPVIPPRPDVSYVGVTTKPPMLPPDIEAMGHGVGHGGSHGGSTPRRRDLPPLPPREDVDWEAREEMWQRELEEVKLRAAQMEKTMRWWSDCTANWREKWSKVRNERNKAREESRHLRSKLEAAVKEITSMKRDKQELTAEVETIKKQLELYTGEKERASVASSAGSQKSGSDHDNVGLDHLPDHELSLSRDNVSHSEQTFVDKLLSKKEKDSTSSSMSSHAEKHDKKKSSRRDKEEGIKGSTPEESIAVQQKLAHLEAKLEEAHKTIHLQKEEKIELSKQMERAQQDVSALQAKQEEICKSRDDALEQLDLVREQHRDELGRISIELEDESVSRSNMDKRLADLRKELERLQAENAAEWGRRERLESEKLALERENKKLRNEIANLNEEVERKGRMASNMMDADFKVLQQDLMDKTKELAEVKHTHSKLKKLVAEKTTELEHAQRRSEQYEMEVKKLRARIEDLKKDLATAEDEVDQQANSARRLQRTNDELQEQIENLQVHVEHLTTRLRRSTSQTLLSGRAGLGYDPNESTTEGEGASDDADDEDE